MKISAVPNSDYIGVWPLIANYMMGCAEYTYGRYTADDMLEGLQTNDWQLWIAYDDKIYGAVITGVTTYPQMKALTMHFTGGIELPKWKTEMLSVLRSFSQDMDCKVIESFGRPGWGKVFKQDGYEAKFTFYELPVEN
jgi:hypothetical protein